MQCQNFCLFLMFFFKALLYKKYAVFGCQGITVWFLVCSRSFLGCSGWLLANPSQKSPPQNIVK